MANQATPNQATVHTMSAESLEHNVAFTTALANLQSKIDEICLFGDKTINDGNYMEIMADLKTIFEEQKNLRKSVYNTTIVQQAVQRSAARPRKSFVNKEAKLKHKDYTTCNLCDEVITRGYRVPHQKTMKCRRMFITKKLALKPIGHKIAHDWANLKDEQMCVPCYNDIDTDLALDSSQPHMEDDGMKEIITRKNRREWSNMNTFVFVDRCIRAKLDRHFEKLGFMDTIPQTPSGKDLYKLYDIKKAVDLAPSTMDEMLIFSSEGNKFRSGKFGAPYYMRPNIPAQVKDHTIWHNDYIFVDELLAIEPAQVDTPAPTPKPKKLKKKIKKIKKKIVVVAPEPEPVLSNDIITTDDEMEAERNSTPTLPLNEDDDTAASASMDVNELILANISN